MKPRTIEFRSFGTRPARFPSQGAGLTRIALLALFCWSGAATCAFAQKTGETPVQAALPVPLRTVLENTRRLESGRGEGLPLYVLPISNALRGLSDERAEEVLSELASRGIGYTVGWSPTDRDKTLAEGLRIARIARRVGLPVAVDATACIDGFFDGEPATLHIDEQGRPFADLSFDPGRQMGCPLALAARVPPIRERVEFFLRGYAQAGGSIAFIFADWEIDGPLEWNDAWSNSMKCRRCRAGIEKLGDFRQFQRQVRAIRSDLQRQVFAEPVRSRFALALVGNYGVYPHGGHRYWYDYYERLPDGAPFLPDQKARYREWADEFDGCRYTIAMPVVYSWYPIYGWYDFANTDYRWFYNGLLVGSNVGKHTKSTTPILTFVHRNTTAPPAKADLGVKPFSPSLYQELLWHLLLRGHDGFFLWCLPEELAQETQLVHEVYSASLAYREFLDHGEPVTFDVPKVPGPVVSALRVQKRVLVRRTDFDAQSTVVRLAVGKHQIEIPAGQRECQVFTLP